MKSLPTRERELKLILYSHHESQRESLPTRERELKRYDVPEGQVAKAVAPYTGA